MKATLQQWLGVLLMDLPRYLWALVRGGDAYLAIRNRSERLCSAPDGSGYRCDWRWTSDLHAPKVIPALGKRLMGRAMASHPIGNAEVSNDAHGEDPQVSFIIGHRGKARLPHLLATLRSIAAQQGVTLFFILMLHLIASLLVDLSPRDGLRIYVPMVLIYALGLALDRYLSTSAALRLAIIAPIVGLPGLLWSLWRHRAFADQFLARAMVERYDRVTREVAEARRVHEAMFPPPVTRGKVHIHYRYEPMLDIGGDFLFIHPLSASRTAADVPISIVVIDVTGHGFPAALAVNRLYVELTRAFASSDDPSPAHVIAELNRSMSSGLMPEGIYATAAVLRARADNGKRVLEWCGAGHPDAMLRRANGDLVHLRSSSPRRQTVNPVKAMARLRASSSAPAPS